MAMAELLKIKLKNRNGGDTIIDSKDVESFYFGEVVEIISYKDNQLRRCKKAREVGIRLKESADKFCCGGRMGIFERLMSEQRIYSVELLYSDGIEEILVPYESDDYFSVNKLQRNKIEKGMKIVFKQPLPQ